MLYHFCSRAWLNWCETWSLVMGIVAHNQPYSTQRSKLDSANTLYSNKYQYNSSTYFATSATCQRIQERESISCLPTLDVTTQPQHDYLPLFKLWQQASSSTSRNASPQGSRKIVRWPRRVMSDRIWGWGRLSLPDVIDIRYFLIETLQAFKTCMESLDWDIPNSTSKF